jgi:4-hydroxy-3-methylbut-2-enyl diphosphate reductase
MDTVCQPTKLRQTAAVDLACWSDVVIVIGGANSNNTRELVNTCSRHCARVHHVESESDLLPEWFLESDTIGITAGTSTPDAVIDLVQERIQRLAGRGVVNAPRSIV